MDGMQVLATALSRDDVQRCPTDAKAALLQDEELVPLLLSVLAELPPLGQQHPAPGGPPAGPPVRASLPECHCDLPPGT